MSQQFSNNTTNDPYSALVLKEQLNLRKSSLEGEIVKAKKKDIFKS